jgi:hypothetical protein
MWDGEEITGFLLFWSGPFGIILICYIRYIIFKAIGWRCIKDALVMIGLWFITMAVTLFISLSFN